MINSLRNVFKQRFPGKTGNNVFYVNIYRNGEFKFAFRFVDWTPEAVEQEILKIESRFPQSSGFSVVK